MNRFRKLILIALGLLLFPLLACSLTWNSDGDLPRAERPAATSTPGPAQADGTRPDAVKGPSGLMAAPPPESTPLAELAPQSIRDGDLTNLSTADQLSLVVAPTRDLRDLALRLNPEVDDIPLVVNTETPDYAVGDRHSFWVHDLGANSNFEVTAELVHKTDVAYVWVEEDRAYDRAAIVRSVDRFSEQSYPAEVAFLGSEWNPGVDNDPRLHILHAYGIGNGIAGYYSSADQYSRLALDFSNQKEMFYVNLGWLNSSRNYEYYETVLAHEFQHMVHWYQDRNEETWVNEGLSEFAQEIAGYDPDTLFARTFSTVPDTQLNTWSDDQDNNGVHYGSAYLFMAYFYQRFGEDAMRALVANPANGIRGFDAVLSTLGLGPTFVPGTDNAAAPSGEPQSGYGFDGLFADWVVANYVDDPNALGLDGVYGYRNFSQSGPVLDQTYDDYPVPERQSTVQNYGADYVLLKGAGDIAIHFQGQTTTQFANMEPEQGAFAWWSHRGDDFNTRLTRRFDLRTLDPGSRVNMDVAMWWDIEDDYDFGYVLASRDGKKWDFLAGSRATEDESGGNSFGPGYTGQSGRSPNGEDDGEPLWVNEQFDLRPYAGEEIWVRFEYVTDDAVNGSGWFVDDLAIPALDYYVDWENGAEGWESEGWLLTDNRLDQRWLLQVLLFDENILAGVERYEVDPEGAVTIPVQGLSETRTAVLVISAMAPVTTEPAHYSYRIEQVQ